jgi:hypothetical protein
MPFFDAWFCWCDVSLACATEKEVENTPPRVIRKKEHSVQYICLCDETTHSYERKTNGSKKRASFAITARFERADIQMRSRVQNTVEKRSVQQFSLLCFWLFFFVLCEIFFFESPTQKKTNQLQRKV